MVVGLLEGLGTRFGMEVNAALSSLRNDEQPYDEFKVEWCPMPVAT